MWKETNVTRKKRNARKYRFVTSHEPAFPDIKKILLKHQHIILDDDELKKVFPYGAEDFQVSKRREAKNLKELLAKSRIATVEVDGQNGGNQPCNSFIHSFIFIQLRQKFTELTEITSFPVIPDELNIKEYIPCIESA